MGRIYVCGLEAMPEHVACLRPGHLVSLVPPEEQPPTPPQVRSALHLRLGINDISEPQPGQILPPMGHVERLVAFLRDWSDDRDLLLHCVAGISRSMAAALIAMALASPGREIEAATPGEEREPTSTYKPFADLADVLKRKK